MRDNRHLKLYESNLANVGYPVDVVQASAAEFRLDGQRVSLGWVAVTGRGLPALPTGHGPLSHGELVGQGLGRYVGVDELGGVKGERDVKRKSWRVLHLHAQLRVANHEPYLWHGISWLLDGLDPQRHLADTIKGQQRVGGVTVICQTILTTGTQHKHHNHGNGNWRKLSGYLHHCF